MYSHWHILAEESTIAKSCLPSHVDVCIYCITLNYGQSHINTWSCLVAGRNSVITKINVWSRINARSFVDL